MRVILPEQMELSREIPPVIGNIDYERFEWRLMEMDRLLRTSGLENDFVRRCLVRQEEEGRREAEKRGVRGA